MIKMELDTRMTPIAYAKDVRNAMKEFKAKYTENDLAMMFRDQFNVFEGYGYDVIKTDVSAFWDMLDETTHFAVDMVLMSRRIAFVTYRFYCREQDGILKFSEDEVLREVHKYSKDA